jgi:ABC-2 type transport system ATP-binding protein
MSEILAIRTENLTKEFRGGSLIRRRSIVALEGLNLHVNRGEIFGYLGPNGAGKTTTFKLLLGLIFPTAGDAWVLGKHIKDVRVRKHIGFLPEQPYFYDYLTAKEFLDFYAQLFGFDKKTRKQRVRNLLSMVGLEEAASNQLRKFSRGMLQRIGVAQALINDPELVILDEPLSGLDPSGRKEIRDIIFHLKSEGRTVIFSSHILSDVEAICDRVGILVKGRLQTVEYLDRILDYEVESIELTVSGLNGVGKENIRSLGCQVMQGENRTVITIPGVNLPEGEESIAKVFAVVRESGARLVSVMSRTQSLESLFMKLNTSHSSPVTSHSSLVTKVS